MKGYQQKYWNEYYSYVKSALERDGYSNSDSNTETTVRDTFYLERNDKSVDFMSWFKDEKTLEAAEKRIEELLIEAKREKSNLKTDIKYYTRDIRYFADFIWNGSKEPVKEEQKEFTFVKNLKENVRLVKNIKTGLLYVEKRYDTYDENVYDKLQKLNIEGIPEIVKTEKVNNILYITEEYIDGQTLSDVFEKEGLFSDKKAEYVALKLCGILKKFHSQSPAIIHRAIKPSNIMTDNKNNIYLIDFNISKERHDNRTEDTRLLGTRHFAAPEQMGYGTSTEETDIYGLGVTLNYLMTGMYPNVAIVQGKWNSIIKKCVMLDKGNRYQSVDELEQAIISAQF